LDLIVLVGTTTTLASTTEGTTEATTTCPFPMQKPSTTDASIVTLDASQNSDLAVNALADSGLVYTTMPTLENAPIVLTMSISLVGPTNINEVDFTTTNAAQVKYNLFKKSSPDQTVFETTLPTDQESVNKVFPDSLDADTLTITITPANLQTAVTISGLKAVGCFTTGKNNCLFPVDSN
jgi:hypothetical protein